MLFYANFSPSLTVSELFSWLQTRFRPPIRPSDPDTMTNTALEATASPSGTNKNTIYLLITTTKTLIEFNLFGCKIGISFVSPFDKSICSVVAVTS